MVLLTWLGLLVLLTLLFSRWLDEQRNPNRDLSVDRQNGGSGEVVLKRNRLGHYVAPGLINDVPVVFLIDTGATHVAVSEALANRIGLKKEARTTSMTANGVVESWLTRLSEVRLGVLSLRNVRATIIPTMSEKEVLLGMSFLKHLELVQRGEQMILRAPGG
jgi:aspartyl protease family protein